MLRALSKSIFFPNFDISSQSRISWIPSWFVKRLHLCYELDVLWKYLDPKCVRTFATLFKCTIERCHTDKCHLECMVSTYYQLASEKLSVHTSELRTPFWEFARKYTCCISYILHKLQSLDEFNVYVFTIPLKLWDVGQRPIDSPDLEIMDCFVWRQLQQLK